MALQTENKDKVVGVLKDQLIPLGCELFGTGVVWSTLGPKDRKLIRREDTFLASDWDSRWRSGLQLTRGGKRRRGVVEDGVVDLVRPVPDIAEDCVGRLDEVDL